MRIENVWHMCAGDRQESVASYRQFEPAYNYCPFCGEKLEKEEVLSTKERFPNKKTVRCLWDGVVRDVFLEDDTGNGVWGNTDGYDDWGKPLTPVKHGDYEYVMRG